MMLSDYISAWEQNVLALRKPATIATMRSHARRITTELGAFPLADLTAQRLQKHIAAVSKTMTPRGVRNYWGTLRLILNAAASEGLLEKVPSVALPKVRRSPQAWLTVEQMRQVLIEAKRMGGPWYALFWLLAETGLRIGEALALQYGDIDWQNKAIKIQRSVFAGQLQAPKTDNAVRTISVSDALLRTLEDALPKGPTVWSNTLVFATSTGRPFSGQAILTRRLHPLLTGLGLPKMGFHAFRRGNATLLCSILGVPEKIAAMRLGHAAPGLTLGVYAQTITFADREWAEKIYDKLFDVQPTGKTTIVLNDVASALENLGYGKRQISAALTGLKPNKKFEALFEEALQKISIGESK